jgi:hypothetical protein
MLAFDLLRVVLARGVLFRSEMPRVRAPMTGMIARDPKRLPQRLQPQKHRGFAAATDIRQDGAGTMMLGKDKAQYLAACFLILPV